MLTAPDCSARDPLGLYTTYQNHPTGFKLHRELENKAFLSWKVKCVGCNRQWGEYEQFEYGDERQQTQWDEIVPLLRRHLREMGFAILQNDAVLCPLCQGKEFDRLPLEEAWPPETLQAPWLTTLLEKQHP